MGEKTRRQLHCGCGESLCGSLYLRYRVTPRGNGVEGVRDRTQKGCSTTRVVTDRER